MIPRLLVDAAVQAGALSSSDSEPVYTSLFTLYAVIGSIVGLLVLGWLAVALVRFRAGRRAAPAPVAESRERGHTGWILSMAGVTALVLFGLAFGTINAVNFIETPPDEDALRVTATGFRYAWTFDYPLGFQSLGDLVVPVGKVVILNVTSRDVVHKLQISDYKIGIDAVPGRTNQMWFRATSPGVAEARCAELCGIDGHYLMVARVVAVEPAEFERWVESKVAPVAPGGIVQEVRLVLQDDRLEPATSQVVAAGEIHVRIENAGTEAQNFTVAEPLNATVPHLPPGTTTWLNLTIPDAWSHAAATPPPIAWGSASASGTLRLRAPRVIPVVLREFTLSVGEPRIPLGEPVLFDVDNQGQGPHDVAFGRWATKADGRTFLAHSALIDPGKHGRLLAQFRNAGTWDAWCDVPGHGQLGMKATFEVTS